MTPGIPYILFEIVTGILIGLGAGIVLRDAPKPPQSTAGVEQMTRTHQLQIFQRFQFGKVMPRNVWASTKRMIGNVPHELPISDYHGQVLSTCIAAHLILGVGANTNALRTIVESCDVGNPRISHGIGIREECPSISDNLGFYGFRRRNRCGYRSSVILRRSDTASSQSRNSSDTNKQPFHGVLQNIKKFMRSEHSETEQPQECAGVVSNLRGGFGTGAGRSAQDTVKIGFSTKNHTKRSA